MSGVRLHSQCRGCLLVFYGVVGLVVQTVPNNEGKPATGQQVLQWNNSREYFPAASNYSK